MPLLLPLMPPPPVVGEPQRVRAACRLTASSASGEVGREDLRPAAPPGESGGVRMAVAADDEHAGAMTPRFVVVVAVVVGGAGSMRR